jgi:methionine synthase II (cobalamin-independent)
LLAAGRELRTRTWCELRDAGLDSIPSNTFSHYDHVLDTAELFGVLPSRPGLSPLDTYFAAARGVQDAPALEMTKWFDTNYHYIVPELGPDTEFTLAGTKPLDEYREARALGIETRPVLVGPVTFLLLAKGTGGFRPLDLLDSLLPRYADLLARLHDEGVEWVQLDEPAFTADRTDAELNALIRAYHWLGKAMSRPKLLVAGYFGRLGRGLGVLARAPIDALAVDLVTDESFVDAVAAEPALRDKEVVAGVVDGRNVWRTDPRRALSRAATLGLPPLPTTTIGSFPQTAEVRRARATHRAGTLDDAGYDDAMRAEIERVVRLQEDLGLDVLVHGEPERNDMVQYFAEQLAGFATTAHGWVQSYGSRCVRPPILHGDVSRPAPMTVSWARHAQSLTAKPIKGMLTGPVTILAWSFVRDDQPPAETPRQVALAIRDEVHDLEAAGIRIVQVDEPALRELLPLRSRDHQAYFGWAVPAFRLATSGIDDATQIHTHMCYSEFGEVLPAIDALDADVTSIEAARSKMEVLTDLNAAGFSRGVGPGVYDIHSPRVPGVDEVAALLRTAVGAVPAARVWVNPDCGLKTRSYAEVEPALRNLVAAAREVRAELG